MISADQLKEFYTRIVSETNKYWQPFMDNTQVALDGAQTAENIQAAQQAGDTVRCYLGVLAEIQEYSDESETNLDSGNVEAITEKIHNEFADVLFYQARLCVLMNYYCASNDFGDAEYLTDLDFFTLQFQAFRNMLRPSPLKEKHLKLAQENVIALNESILKEWCWLNTDLAKEAVCVKYGDEVDNCVTSEFQLTPNRVLELLHAKLAPRYS